MAIDGETKMSIPIAITTSKQINTSLLSPTYEGSPVSGYKSDYSSLSRSRSPLSSSSLFNLKKDVWVQPSSPLARSWSRGSSSSSSMSDRSISREGLRSGTTTVVPTRHSSPAPAPHIIRTPSTPPVSPSPQSPSSSRIKGGRRIRYPSSTRQRGRSHSQRKVQLSPLVLNSRPNYGRWDSIRDGHAPAPVYRTTKGPAVKRLPTAGVDACKRWLSAGPPASWLVRSQEEEARRVAFRRETMTERLPRIVQQAIDETEHALQCTVSEQNLLLLYTQHSMSIYDLDVHEEMLILDDKIADLEKCIKRMKPLYSQLVGAKPLRKFRTSTGDDDVYQWNDHLEHIARETSGPLTFSTAPLLFAEAYVYRRLEECFSLSTWWAGFDPFKRTKMESFLGSTDIAGSLATRFGEPVEFADCLFPWEHKATIKEQFAEITRALLPVRRTDDAVKVEEGIEALWNAISQKYEQGGGRVDVVLGRSGLDLFCDLLYADFLVQSGLATEVRFHGKRMPWFVTEATKVDWDWTQTVLLDSNSFSGATWQQRRGLQTLGRRWKSFTRSGQFRFEHHPFWCTGYTYWDLPLRAPGLLHYLSQSQLLIFKGDLNYRKLTYDDAAPSGTPFELAIGPMGVKRTAAGNADAAAPTIACLAFSPLGVYGEEYMDSREGERWTRDGLSDVIAFA